MSAEKTWLRRLSSGQKSHAFVHGLDGAPINRALCGHRRSNYPDATWVPDELPIGRCSNCLHLLASRRHFAKNGRAA